MTLLELGLPAGRFRVDAVDVSARSLARAIAGVYGPNSFRGVDGAVPGAVLPRARAARSRSTRRSGRPSGSTSATCSTRACSPAGRRSTWCSAGTC